MTFRLPKLCLASTIFIAKPFETSSPNSSDQREAWSSTRRRDDLVSRDGLLRSLVLLELLVLRLVMRFVGDSLGVESVAAALRLLERAVWTCFC